MSGMLVMDDGFYFFILFWSLEYPYVIVYVIRALHI